MFANPLAALLGEVVDEEKANELKPKILDVLQLRAAFSKLQEISKRKPLPDNYPSYNEKS